MLDGEEVLYRYTPPDDRFALRGRLSSPLDPDSDDDGVLDADDPTPLIDNELGIDGLPRTVLFVPITVADENVARLDVGAFVPSVTIEFDDEVVVYDPSNFDCIRNCDAIEGGRYGYCTYLWKLKVQPRSMACWIGISVC